MIEQNECGVCNFTNPGQIRLDDILNIYNETPQQTQKRSFTINNTNNENKRSFAKLHSDKLIKYSPLDIVTAIKGCCEKYDIPQKQM
jgi:hypothetical protein